MSQYHNITESSKADAWRSNYATTELNDMQTWFIKVEGIDKPIMQTTKIDSPPPSGQTYGTMEEFMGKKSGKPYYKFKRSQAPDGFEKPAETVQRQTAPTDGLAVKVAQLEQRVAKLEGGGEANPGIDSTPVADVVIKDEDVDEPVDMSDIPFS